MMQTQFFKILEKEMGSQRSSNFEFLRILLMITIPIYHLMLYNGMFFTELNGKAVIAIFLSAGGAITADYAFIALSAYFLIKSNPKFIFKRVFMVAMQMIMIYFARFIIIRSLFGFDHTNVLLEEMILQGAWWYGYCYLILLLIYPLLNKIIRKYSEKFLTIICWGLGSLVIINWVNNQISLAGDVIMFLFVYFCMGAWSKNNYKRVLGVKNKKHTLIMIYLAGFLLNMTGCMYVKMMLGGNIEKSGQVVAQILGKYSIISFFMGIAVFMLFAGIKMSCNNMINKISRTTFFVFLLHETLIGIGWYYWKICDILRILPMHLFILCIIIYVLTCFGIGGIVYIVYEKWLESVFEQYAEKLSNLKLIRYIEERYLKITRS